MYVNLTRNTTRQKPANMADIQRTVSIEGYAGNPMPTADDIPMSIEQVGRITRQQPSFTLQRMQD